jgi:2-keto-4-pentenoate hydratase
VGAEHDTSFALQPGKFLAVKTASGTSASGTPGTTVADLVADTGWQLVALDIAAAQTSTATTQLTVTVTYSDTTTSSVSTSATNAATVHGNNAALELTVGGAHSSLTALSAKSITEVKVVTLGAGTGTRSAALSAIEVPL